MKRFLAKPIRSKKLMTTVVIVGIAVIAAIFIYKNLFGPSEGTIKNTNPQTANTERSPSFIQIDDKYDSFRYPDRYSRLKAEEIRPPVLARYNFATQLQFGSSQIAIQVTKVPSGSLEDEGTYHFRSVTSDRFVRETRVIGQHKLVIFSDKTGGPFAKVGYLQQGDRIASISFMGGDADVLQADFDALITSWQWK